MTSRRRATSSPLSRQVSRQPRRDIGTDNSTRVAARGRPRSAHAHQAILEATLKLLADVGYEKLTLGEVAAVAGVGKATIYRRWPSKVSLVIESFLQLPALVAPDTGNVLDDLTTLLRSFAHILETTPLPRVLPILAAECLYDPELSKLFVPMVNARRQPLLDVLRSAVARHELPGDLDLEAAVDLIVGPIITRLHFSARPVRPRDIRPFVEAALYGIHRLRRP
ncbi:TetR/AcrR family transcriptional regulator [Steroidobacter denitrificans]|uniref:TetR/AcrR family transcriptional regulator n=1 Tax=Steroidobacter denitrificans TaxID=465721 RepID=UPI0009F9FFC8|nr:TetR/AcrR family transcriptional regulator [Steroidobacter denitrificans]